ncbi:MAG: PAS domain S-box protein [Actinomycetota bacterium]
MVDTATPDGDIPSPITGVPAEVLWAASADGMVLVDAEGVIRATNAALDDLLGHPPGALVGRCIDELVPLDRRPGHAELRQDYEADPATRPMAASRLLHALRADGTSIPVNVSLARLPTGSGEMTMAAVRDLRDRVAAERREAEAERRRSLAEDHDRIASDLHDTVIQRLFALGLDLQGMGASMEDATSAPRVAAAVDTIDEIIDDIRSTIFGLRRRPEEPIGLRQRIMAVVEQMERSLGFAPELRLRGELDAVADTEAAASLEPVIREALSNVARHAGADQASVVVALLEGELRIEVIDNGRGMPPNATRSGLVNLAERALALEGRFAVGAGDGGGTRLVWSVPLVEPLP